MRQLATKSAPLFCGYREGKGKQRLDRLQAEPDNTKESSGPDRVAGRQSIERSTSNRAIISTATKQVFSTERLMPLPRPQDSGTTPTTITSDGA
jgi:hypothetical protein